MQVEGNGSLRGLPEVLHAGDEIRVSPNRGGVSGVARRHVEPEEVALWTSARAMVRDRTVGDAVDAIRPWFHGVIILRGDIARQPLTGVYNLSDPLEALAAVAHAQRCRYVSDFALDCGSVRALIVRPQKIENFLKIRIPGFVSPSRSCCCV
ncbi:hypothetical protein RAA17_25705 [Komagataeibacter rhaeticus]|nr:hypothetical protein [Komagataeibacter rhaeticus]